MAGTVQTKPLYLDNPQEISGAYVIKTGEIINEGDLVGVDANGLMVVAQNAAVPVLPLGMAFFNTTSGATARTGDGNLKAAIARRGRLLKATTTNVPGLNKGAAVFLGPAPSANQSNYTCILPGNSSSMYPVGYVEADGTTLVISVDSVAQVVPAVTGIQGLRQMLNSLAKSGYQLIGYRNGTMSGLSSVLTQTDTFRTRHPTVYAAQSIILVYQNFYMPSGGHETAGVSAVTVRASIEDPTLITGQANGTALFPVFFQGQRNANMDINGWLVSDPVDGINIPGLFDPFGRGQSAWALMIRSAATVSAGQYPVSGNLIMGGSGTIQQDGRGNNDGKTANDGGAGVDSGTITPATGNPFGPCAVLGLVYGNPKPSLVFEGCSLEVGTGDNFGQATNNTTEMQGKGYAVRAASFYNIPVGGWAVGGETIQRIGVGNQINGKLRITSSRLGPATLLLGTFATNDITSRTAVQIEADYIARAQRAKSMGKTVIVVTTPPKLASTTDFCQTALNQTPGPNEAVRQAWNLLCRTTLLADAAGAIDYVWDIAAAVEVDTTNALNLTGGRMKVGQTYATVPAGTLSTSSGTTLTDSAAPFTANMQGAAILATAGKGTTLSTTVTTGATSATQQVGDTTGMAANQIFYFQTSGIFAIVSTVVDGTHVTFTASITTQTGETLQQTILSPITTVTDSSHIVIANSSAVDSTTAYKIFQCPFTNLDFTHFSAFIDEMIAQTFNPAWANVV